MVAIYFVGVVVLAVAIFTAGVWVGSKEGNPEPDPRKCTCNDPTYCDDPCWVKKNFEKYLNGPL